MMNTLLKCLIIVGIFCCVPISRALATVFSFSPTLQTFPNQTVGTTSVALTTTVKNIGANTVKIGSISIIGLNPGDFAQTHTCGTLLAVGSNCLIRTTFSPSATGTRFARVAINTAGTQPHRESSHLTGVGVSNSLKLVSSPSSVTIKCDAGAGTILSQISTTGGNGNPVQLSIAGDTTDFGLSGNILVVVQSGITLHGCLTALPITMTLTLTATQQ